MKDNVTGLTLTPHAVDVRQVDGTIFLQSRSPLDNIVDKTGVWLHKWAEKTPKNVFLGERSGEGWRELSYAETLGMVQALAASLLARGLNESTPIVVMSGNGVDHALLSFAAQYVGIPTVPVAEQYSLIPGAHERLLFVLNKIKPAMVFVDDAGLYAEALKLPVFDSIEVLASRDAGSPIKVTAFAELLKGDASVDLNTAYNKVGPDSLAKILFTSGSSSDPKGVMTTQKMMCANQAQMSSVLPFLKEGKPRIVDWLPWNHVFGGSHNVNMMLAHGGSLYIDDGKPTPSAFARTVENITQKAGTLAFNVPVGFSMLVAEMKTNKRLREAYFKDLDMLFYAGASLPQDVWSGLEEMALEVRGRLPLMISSWGMTETAPATLMVHEPIGRSGVIGVPLPGTEIKLSPDDEMRCELRVKGLNITPGYWQDAEKTAEAFDEDGFLITGDAVRFVNFEDPDRGLVFDGRVSEDFKLLTGTWVQAGKLRLDALEALRGQVQDLVICGHDRNEVGLFVFPRHDQIEGLACDGGAVLDEQLLAELQKSLKLLAEDAAGSARRIARAIVLSEPPSLKNGEVTDKGSLNVRKIFSHRADLIERLYDNADPAVIRV